MTENVNIEEIVYHPRYAGKLIEQGILVGEGEIIVEGKILEYAREFKRLWESKDYVGFLKLSDKSMTELDDDNELLMYTDISESWTLLYMLDDIMDLPNYASINEAAENK